MYSTSPPNLLNPVNRHEYNSQEGGQREKEIRKYKYEVRALAQMSGEVSGSSLTG